MPVGATKPRRTNAQPPAAKAKAVAKPKPATGGAVSGYSPAVWGPHMWFMFHLVAATYPAAPTAADKANYAAFYKSLRHVLPCVGCQQGYATIIGSEPTKLGARTFGTRDALFKWTVDVHNRVNAKLGKPVHADWRAWYREYDKLRA